MIKKTAVCLLIVFCAVLGISAQSISEIKDSKAYLWGEGRGITLTEADRAALDDLITQISVTVESRYSKVDENIVVKEGVSTQSSFKAVLQTYSNATLQNTERFVISNEPDAHVFRFVKKPMSTAFLHRAVPRSKTWYRLLCGLETTVRLMKPYGIFIGPTAF